MVDVETGDEPRPLRKLDKEPPARPPERPASGGANGRSVKRPRSKPDPAGVPLRPIQREVSPQETPGSVPPSRIPEADRTPATFGADELLWLEEPSGDPIAEPDGGSTKLPLWKRGLRG